MMRKRVLCLLNDGFEEIEVVAPVDILRRAGIDVVIAAAVVAGAVVLVVVVAAVPVRLARNDRSDEPRVFWCTSTASTFVPARISVGSTSKARSSRSFDPQMALGARVEKLTGPFGRLNRATSVPLRYATAPSSTRSRTARSSGAPDAENWWRKYVVVYFGF